MSQRRKSHHGEDDDSAIAYGAAADKGPFMIQIPEVHLDKTHGFVARLMVPLFSASYKSDMTAHCLLKALHEPPNTDTLPESPYSQPQSESESPLLPDSPLWHAPPLVHNFSLSTFFSMFHAHFRLAAPALFATLRREVYGLSDSSYRDSLFDHLTPLSGLGFSGSLFFCTADARILLKSIGRRFEYSFLHERMLDALGAHLLAHHRHRNDASSTPTLLCRITDVLYCSDHRFGGWLGVSPGHYLVMQNVLHGIDKKRPGCKQWDLKPVGFWEPTRDLVPDGVKSEAAKSGLADALDEPIVLCERDREELLEMVSRDTEFLEKMGTVDYSLLLGRYPIEMFTEAKGEFSMPKEGSKDWFTGVKSGDGKWVYRVTLLDFLWNIEQLKPKVMRTAGKLLPEQTVTTGPERYRDEFLKMVEKYTVLPGEEERFYEDSEEEGAG